MDCLWSGAVVLVDASPIVISALRKSTAPTARGPNVAIVHAAIANQTGTTTFYDNKDSKGAGVEALSNMLYRPSYPHEPLCFFPTQLPSPFPLSGLVKPTTGVRWQNWFTKAYTVPVMPLRTIVAALPDGLPIEILKTNIEGFDLAGRHPHRYCTHAYALFTYESSTLYSRVD